MIINWISLVIFRSTCRLYGLRKYKSKIKTDKEVISHGINEKRDVISQPNNDKNT